MVDFSIGYTLLNRGRGVESSVKAIKEFISNNPNFILFLDETDATDKEIGLDGRIIFKHLNKLKLPNYNSYIDANEEVGINFIHSDSFKILNKKLKQINEKDLKYPQGVSEHYKQHQLILKSKVKGISLNFIVQHNSAFIRPFRRMLQTINSMKDLNKLQTRNNITFLIRDQNTWIPGEGRLERLLRRIYKVHCLTDNIKRSYKLKYLEGDTGGLNNLAYKLIRIGIADFINKNIITIMDKVESICVLKNVYNLNLFTFETTHTDITGLDHGLLMTKITVR